MKRYLPLTAIALLMAIAYAAEVHTYLSFQKLQEQRSALSSWVTEHPLIAPLSFMLLYALLTALSIPGAAIMSVCGGFLFPQPLCTLYVVIGATVGAIGIFQAARTALGNHLKQRASPFMDRIKQGVHEDGWSYLLFLRLVPIFPFWLVNLAPAFIGVSLSTFAWTTFVGIIPGAFVFTQAGTGLGAILDSGQTFTFANIFNTQVKLALLALGVFALIPLIFKKFRYKA